MLGGENEGETGKMGKKGGRDRMAEKVGHGRR
jgi:hypothetical protein